MGAFNQPSLSAAQGFPRPTMPAGQRTAQLDARAGEARPKGKKAEARGRSLLQTGRFKFFPATGSQAPLSPPSFIQSTFTSHAAFFGSFLVRPALLPYGKRGFRAAIYKIARPQPPAAALWLQESTVPPRPPVSPRTIKKAKGDFMNIDKEKIAKQAEKFGFTAVWFPVSEIPTNPEYLKYCEVNRCGNYRANYACPPDCGTPDEMRARLQSASAALVIQSQWSVPGYGTPEVLSSKAEHGAAVRRFRDALRKEGYDVFAVGYGPCSVCKPCKRKSGDPCPLPDQRVSCMSAYCVDVAALAARCALPFEWNPQRLYLFGMIMFRGE